MKNFLLCLLFTAFSFTSYAQFYDDDDEVVFYETLLPVSGESYIIAFNLYGDKGVVLTGNYLLVSIDVVAINLGQDPTYYQKCIFDETKHLKIYASKNRPNTYYADEPMVTGDNSLGYYRMVQYIHSYTYEFSYDRSSLKLISEGYSSKDTTEYIFKRITKEELMNKIAQKNKPWRERTNNNSLYE